MCLPRLLYSLFALPSPSYTFIHFTPFSLPNVPFTHERKQHHQESHSESEHCGFPSAAGGEGEEIPVTTKANADVFLLPVSLPNSHSATLGESRSRLGRWLFMEGKTKMVGNYVIVAITTIINEKRLSLPSDSFQNNHCNNNNSSNIIRIQNWHHHCHHQSAQQLMLLRREKNSNYHSLQYSGSCIFLLKIYVSRSSIHFLNIART